MRNTFVLILLVMGLTQSCQKTSIDEGEPSELISIDSLIASVYTLKAWDTTTISCYAVGDSITYEWECDHGNINGNGYRIKYAAGECCVGINTLICTVSNYTGKVSQEIKIEVTSYYDE